MHAGHEFLRGNLCRGESVERNRRPFLSPSRPPRNSNVGCVQSYPPSVTTSITMSSHSKTNGASPSVEQRTANLIQWTSSLSFSDLPEAVVDRTKSFLLDTIACSIAGQTHPAVQAMLSFAAQMGPKDGPCEYFFAPEKRTSAAFSALVNGAASHVVELDDLNNAGMIHPVSHHRNVRYSL